MKEWAGVCDGDPWKLEVETDCFTKDEPFVVSMFIVNGDPKNGREIGLAALSAEQARDLATALFREADNVDANNARVARFLASEEERT